MAPFCPPARKATLTDLHSETKERADAFREQARLFGAKAELAVTAESRAEWLQLATEWLRLADETENLLRGLQTT